MNYNETLELYTPEPEYMSLMALSATSGKIQWPARPHSLAIVSLFRDRVGHLQRYFQQIHNIQGFDKVYVVCVENDSKDGTRRMLEKWGYRDKYIIGQPTGEPLYGSVVHSERMRILSQAANLGLDFVASYINSEYTMFIESDIIWAADVPSRLCEQVALTDGIVSPMVYTERDKLFYDIWAFRNSEDDHWLPHAQSYYRKNLGSQVAEVWSSGTCVAFHTQALRKGVRFQPEDAIVGFCRSAKQFNYRILVDTSVEIYHPQ